MSHDEQKMEANKGQFLVYKTKDGRLKLDVRLENDTVWLTQQLMAKLFQTSQQNISQHLVNIYEEKELEQESTHKKFLSVQKEGNRDVKRLRDFYNLDMIISIGYRVKSHVATRFRIWATERLKEYIVKGFTLDDDRLKEAGAGNYFDELLARIRDIRSSEKVFWRKVLDIYATSIDYDPNTEQSQLVFKTIQNKMHWASHGETAAETVYKRVDSTKENIGLPHFSGDIPTKNEVEITKNYLTADELDILNRMVSAYLEIAEIQALNRTPMYMTDWIEQLDNFLTMTGKEILRHPGEISHQEAIDKAHTEYEKYKEKIKNRITQVEKDFIKQIENKAKRLKNDKIH